MAVCTGQAEVEPAGGIQAAAAGGIQAAGIEPAGGIQVDGVQVAGVEPADRTQEPQGAERSELDNSPDAAGADPIQQRFL